MEDLGHTVREARSLMRRVSLVLEYRLAAARAPLLLRRYRFLGASMPASARGVARHAAGGDLDRVWAARDDEQCWRNRIRAKSWRTRYSDHARTAQ